MNYKLSLLLMLLFSLGLSVVSIIYVAQLQGANIQMALTFLITLSTGLAGSVGLTIKNILNEEEEKRTNSEKQ